jgi:hypothetical protein
VGRRGGFLGAGRVSSGEKREGGRWERERNRGEREQAAAAAKGRRRQGVALRVGGLLLLAGPNGPIGLVSFFSFFFLF